MFLTFSQGRTCKANEGKISWQNSKRLFTI
nr:MAG TPA: hypothetical protein [Herelleviridae sp.]